MREEKKIGREKQGRQKLIEIKERKKKLLKERRDNEKNRKKRSVIRK